MAGELLSDLELAGLRIDAAPVAQESVCSVYRSGDYHWDDVEADGTIAVARETIYSSIDANLSPIMSRRDRFDEFGNALIFTRQYRVRVAWDIDQIRVGDFLVIEESNDPMAVDREFVVRDVVISENNTTRILTVQDSKE